MAERSFVHLHCHSHYSLLDGANRIPELVARVKELGMNAIALTDHGNLYGAVEFYRECKAAGVNPVIGYEAYVAPNKRTDREQRRANGQSDDAIYHHLTLLAKDLTGFRNLIKMSSVAFLEGYHYGKPRIDKELLEAHSEGIICLSGCAAAEFSDHILRDRMDDARKLAEWFARLFKDRFYVEIQNNGLDIQRTCAEGAIDIANQLGLPLVATSDAHYLKQEDHLSHDVLLCINTGRSRSNPNRFKFSGDQFHIRPPEEMYRLFPGHEDAVKRSQEIADAVQIELDFKKRHFPVFTPPDKKKAEDYLRELAAEGLRDRYDGKPPPEAAKRLEHELDVICRMGFASYFLIVWDFVRFAREQGIPASARGSACGALVSYVLKLSHVDPLEYDLLFERFLDPNRGEAPDIDIDFCQDRREEVIAYVKQKYGEASVAQIVTFGTLAAKAAIKDVGRALDVPLERVNQLTAMVPKTLGTTLDDALKQSPDLKHAYEGDVLVRELIDIARRLEGTNRNAGTHAAGVVIANGPLTDYVPVQRITRKGDDGAKRDDAAVTTQWVMGDLEKIGLLKMDFLGLRTLTLLENAVRLIEKTRGEKLDLFRLPLDDQKTYALLQRGDAKGVFQFESEGIRELLKRLRPDNIRDIIACTALYRPGPLGGGMVDAYVNRKHGREKPQYPHAVMEEILTETFGVLCIAEGTLVAMADGTQKPIQDVRAGDRVQTLDLRTRQFEVRECHGCGPTRRGDGVEVTLENGCRVTLTDDHPVLTWDGFQQAGELDPEVDLIAAGIRMAPESSCAAPLAPWLGADEDVAYLLGLLIGDGCMSGPSIALCTGRRDAHERIVVWLRERLPELRLHEYFHCRSWYVGLSCPKLLNAPPHGNRKTQFRHFLESLGMLVRSADKFVPDVILRASPAVRAAFLAGLLDSDGHWEADVRGIGICFYTSTSERLLDGVVRLCQLEGIKVTRRPGRVHLWSQQTLADLVRERLIVRHCPDWLVNGDTLGWVPRRVMTQCVAAVGSQRGFARATGIERSTVRARRPFIRSSTAAKCGLSTGDVLYYRIRSMRRVSGLQFYGMSVAEHHNLVANGVVVKNCYQEQVMRILNRLGGIELASAYACIKAISKKKQDIIDTRKVDFLKGAQDRGVKEETAREVFDLICFFGGYGFNKSHSAAYALVSYQTAYLKAHYTPEFMAALLSSEIEDGNKRDIMVEHIEDARRLGVQVLAPDINAGEADFTVAGGKIVFGLTAIKGVGRGAAEDIVRVRREGGPFRDLFDFCERIDQKVVPRAALERLVKAGALDGFGAHRAQLLQLLPRALQAASTAQEDRRLGQLSLFDGPAKGAEAAIPVEALPDVEPWSDSEKLKYEKEALDFYFSSHPLAEHADVLNRFATHTADQLIELSPKQEVILGGMLSLLRYNNTKTARNGHSRYLRCKLEDLTGAVECVMWPDDLARCREELREEETYFVKGVVERTREQPSLVLTRIMTLEQAQRELAKQLWLLLRLEEHGPHHLTAIANLLRQSPGSVRVRLIVRDAVNRNCLLELGRDYAIDPAKVAVAELEQIVGKGAVKFAGGNGRNGK